MTNEWKNYYLLFFFLLCDKEYPKSGPQLDEGEKLAKQSFLYTRIYLTPPPKKKKPKIKREGGTCSGVRVIPIKKLSMRAKYHLTILCKSI